MRCFAILCQSVLAPWHCQSVPLAGRRYFGIFAGMELLLGIIAIACFFFVVWMFWRIFSGPLPPDTPDE